MKQRSDGRQERGPDKSRALLAVSGSCEGIGVEAGLRHLHIIIEEEHPLGACLCKAAA